MARGPRSTERETVERSGPGVVLSTSYMKLRDRWPAVLAYEPLTTGNVFLVTCASRISQYVSVSTYREFRHRPKSLCVSCSHRAAAWRAVST